MDLHVLDIRFKVITMGRPPKIGFKKFLVTLSEKTVSAIDAARGEVERSQFIDGILSRWAARNAPKSPPTPKKPRPRP